MDMKQAKAKLAEISRSTATKHPKVLINDLCGVIQFLLSELERIETPKMAVLTTLPKVDENRDGVDPTPVKRPNRTSPTEIPQPWKSPPPFRPDTQLPIREVIPTEFKQPLVDKPFTETESN